MSESWQLFFYANSFMRYHLEKGKCRKEFIVSFIIAKNYFSFPAFTGANNKEYKGFQWGKSNCKSKSSFCLNNSHEL